MIRQTIFLTLIIELLTITGRVLFGSVREKYKKVKFKYKIQIHHGYIGLLLVLIYFFYAVDYLYVKN